MTMKATMILSIALCLTAATGVSAQQTIKKGSSISATATIQAIDATKRTITLRDDKGQEDTYAVGSEVKRFDELKVGDKVNMTYYESIVFQIRKPGEKPAEEAVGTAMTRSKGATPGGDAGEKPAEEAVGTAMTRSKGATPGGDAGRAGQDDGHREGNRSRRAVGHRDHA